MEIRVNTFNCPYCHQGLAPGQTKAGCPKCMAWQHVDCLREHMACAACGNPAQLQAPVGSNAAAAPKAGRVGYWIFRSSWDSWSLLFSKAAAFATELGPARVVNVSHSSDKNEGVVTVWFQEEGPPPSGERLRFKFFRSSWDSWAQLFQKAASAASGRRVLGISHCEDKNDGVAVAWYWE